jgi:PKD repeat protein
LVGPSPTSIDFSSNGNILYIAVSGANQTVLVDIDARTVVRTIPLNFSPLSVRHGRPDRLYVSGKGDYLVRVVNETTGAVISSFQPYFGPFESLLDVSPDGTELLVHLRSFPVKMFRYSIVTDTPVLLASDNNDLQGDADQLVVDWTERMAYLSSSYQYGIKRISVDTLTAVRDYVTYAYPAGVALLPGRHLVFGLNSYGSDSALWAFNLTNGSLSRRVPIGSDPSFVVASPFTEMVLVWSPYGVRAFSLAPTVSPRDPAPDTTVPQYPYYVSAFVWTGIPIVTIDRAEIHVNGLPLQASLSGSDILSGFSMPPVPVGIWHITAEVAWGTRSAATTWTATIAPPPPVAGFDQHPRDPLFVGLTIHFDARYSYVQQGAGAITDYAWDFGDGSTGTGAKADVVYRHAGEFNLTLTVRTDIGDSNTTTRRLVVETFPNVTLVPYNHPPSFRALGPSSWNVSENVPIGWSVAELVFRGPTYQTSRTTVMIDERRDSAANETPAYLAGRVDVIVNELRQLGGILTVTEPARALTIAGHEGRTFVAVDTYRGIGYKVALVVSATHERWWVILLTVDPDYLSVYESMFDAMLDGFEITLASPGSPASPAGSVPLVAVAAAAALTVGVIGGVWWALRVRRKRKGSAESRDSENKPPPGR